MTTTLPAVGPVGTARARVDFDLREFKNLIERSPRFVWERSSVCPCTPVNVQTQQPSPNCTRCDGTGFFYFGPPGYVPDTSAAGIGPLDPVQQAVQSRNGGAIIRAFMASAQYRQTAYDRLGTWVWGEMHVTVRPENVIGYYDRLTNLDSEVVYNQIATASAGGARISLRYPAIEVSHIEAANGTSYICGTDFQVVAGDIQWLLGSTPTPGTRLSVHYLCHPAFLITDFPHVIRATTVRRKQIPQSAAGNPQQLPLRGRVRLEFAREQS